MRCLSSLQRRRSTLMATTRPVPRIVGPVDPAEAARGDLVQQAVAAQEVAVGVALEQLKP